MSVSVCGGYRFDSRSQSSAVRALNKTYLSSWLLNLCRRASVLTFETIVTFRSLKLVVSLVEVVDGSRRDIVCIERAAELNAWWGRVGGSLSMIRAMVLLLVDLGRGFL